MSGVLDSNSLVTLGGVHSHLNGRQLVPCSIGATATSITRRAVLVSTRLPHSRPIGAISQDSRGPSGHQGRVTCQRSPTQVLPSSRTSGPGYPPERWFQLGQA